MKVRKVSPKNVSLIYFGFACVSIYYFASNNALTLSIHGAPFILLSALSFTRMAILSQNVWENLSEIICLLFVHVWLGVAPMLQVMLDIYPLPFPVNDSEMAGAGWIILASFLFYFIGRNRRSNHLENMFGRKIREDRTIYFASLSVLICIYLIFEIGPGRLFTSREEMNNVLFTTGRSDNSLGAIKSAALCVPIFISLLGVLQVAHNSYSRRILLVALVVLNLIVNNPVVQSRFWFATVWGTVALVIFGKTRFMSHRIPILILALIFLVFPNADVWRYANSSQIFKIQNPVNQLVSKGDFDSAQQVAWGLKVSESVGLKYGTQIMGASLFFIPRSIWADKPVDTGILLAKAAGYSNTSLSAPLWVEGFIDFGILGTFLYLFLLGKVHSAYRRSTRQNQLSLFVFIPLYQLVILRGSLIQSMAFTSVLLGTSIFLSYRDKSEFIKG